MTFLFEIIYVWKILFEFLTFEIWIFQMISGGEITKTKIVDLEKLNNFVIHNFFIHKKYVWSFSHLKFEFFKRP